MSSVTRRLEEQIAAHKAETDEFRRMWVGEQLDALNIREDTPAGRTALAKYRIVDRDSSLLTFRVWLANVDWEVTA